MICWNIHGSHSIEESTSIKTNLENVKSNKQCGIFSPTTNHSKVKVYRN